MAVYPEMSLLEEFAQNGFLNEESVSSIKTKGLHIFLLKDIEEELFILEHEHEILERDGLTSITLEESNLFVKKIGGKS
jgi:hypothetical protein